MREAIKPIRQALWQFPLLVIMAGLIALLVNHWRETPLPLIGDWSVTARLTDQEGESLAITLNEAKELFQENAVKFLDARPSSQYLDGHIASALSLPWQDVTTAFTDIAIQLDEKDNIITYCDGESCELSHDLALFLKDMGFTNVRVLNNGWTVWQDAGLPTEKTGEANEK